MLNVERSQTVEKSLKAMFNMVSGTRKCNKCHEETETDNWIEKSIFDVPEVLVLNMKRFSDDTGAIVGQKQTAPLELDVAKFHFENLTGEVLLIELFAMVSCKGETLEESEYTSVVLKDEQWVEFSAGSTRDITCKEAETDYDP
jgi:ubiquitin C-terminal hydrolase